MLLNNHFLHCNTQKKQQRYRNVRRAPAFIQVRCWLNGAQMRSRGWCDPFTESYHLAHSHLALLYSYINIMNDLFEKKRAPDRCLSVLPVFVNLRLAALDLGAFTHRCGAQNLSSHTAAYSFQPPWKTKIKVGAGYLQLWRLETTPWAVVEWWSWCSRVPGWSHPMWGSPVQLTA